MMSRLPWKLQVVAVEGWGLGHPLSLSFSVVLKPVALFWITEVCLVLPAPPLTQHSLILVDICWGMVVFISRPIMLTYALCYLQRVLSWTHVQ